MNEATAEEMRVLATKLDAQYQPEFTVGIDPKSDSILFHSNNMPENRQLGFVIRPSAVEDGSYLEMMPSAIAGLRQILADGTYPWDDDRLVNHGTD